MSNPPSVDRKARLYFVLVEWFEEQISTGELKPGDRLPPERKLGEQFGISRTAVREALRSLAARGLIESHVGRGTFVRLPSVDHLAQKLRMLHEGAEHRAHEALVHVVAALVELAAHRHTPEALDKLRSEIEHLPKGVDGFLHCLGEAAGNAMLGALARALARVALTTGSLAPDCVENARRLVACIAEGRAAAAREAVLVAYPGTA